MSTFGASAATGSDEEDGTAANDQTLTYDWPCGDGDTASTTSATIDHTYVSAGEFTVTLVVNDSVVDSAPVMTNASIHRFQRERPVCLQAPVRKQCCV